MLPETRPVLLVDDNPDDRFLFEQAWREAGIPHELISAADGEAALERLRRPPAPGLMLLDIKMPGLSGFEVLRRVREDERLHALPVIMLTASTSPADVERAYALCASAFVVKPSTVGELVACLRALGDFWLRFSEFPAL